MRNLLWSNLIIQRATNLAMMSYVTSDPSFLERAQVSAQSVTAFFPPGENKEWSKNETQGSISEFQSKLQSLQLGTAIKRGVIKNLYDQSNEIGEELNRIEATGWYKLRDHNLALISDSAKNQSRLLEMISLFVGYLIFLGWILKKKRETEQDLKQSEIRLSREALYVGLLQKVAIASNEAKTFDEALQATLDLLCKTLGFSVGHALKKSKDLEPKMISTGIWSMASSTDFSDFSRETESSIFTRGLGLPGRVLESAETISIEDLSVESNFLRRHSALSCGIKGAVAAPVFLDSQMVAILEFFMLTPIKADQQLVEVMSNVGVQIGRVLERVQMEEERIKRNTAEKANQAKSIFLANMSHEIRTPMHGILSFARFGQQKIETASKDKLKNYFDEIYESGSRLMSLLNDLLDLSKLEAGKATYAMIEGDLALAADSVTSEMNAFAEEKGLKIELRRQAGADSIGVFDRDKIMQVFRNLISNAIKFSDPGNTVKITLEQKEEKMLCVVSNRGVGIPESELESVFEKFTQSSKTKTGAGGIGLGLAISREIVRVHGGKIWAESVPNGETKFIFELPLHGIHQASEVA